jgi:uncharacterized Zn-finger protein
VQVACLVCGKTFYHPSILKRHSSIHKRGLPHKCVVCGKAFRRYSCLKTHSITHTEFLIRTYWQTATTAGTRQRK